jgi:hypothetical protein
MLVFADAAAKDGPALDPLLRRVRDRVIGSRRAELAAAMGTASVVMGLVLGQDRPQMLPAEDQHPVGDLSPGGKHEPLRIGVRARAAGRDLHGLDAGVGQDCVERLGELPGPVTDQVPEVRSAITQIHQQVADLLCSPPPVRVRRLGAGGIFRALRIRRMVDALTRWPNLSSSPGILL